MTYVDRSDLTRSFFEDLINVVEYVNKRKIYKTRTSVTYLVIDYQTSDINFKYKFDLAISIYSSKSFLKSLQCLKRNGKLLYLPLPSDREVTDHDIPATLIGIIHKKKKQYVCDPATDKMSYMQRVSSRYLRDERFIDKNTYYLYKRA